MALVKLLRDFPPGWQSGITVDIKGKKLEELLADGSVELLEPVAEKVVEIAEVEEVEEVVAKKPKKKSSKKKV